MNKIKFLIIILIFGCCSKNKGVEDWIKPENQNGSLEFFYASEEYCFKLLEGVREFDHLKNLLDSMRTEIDQLNNFDQTIQSEVLKEDIELLKQIHTEVGSVLYYVYQNMVEYTGGYCGVADVDLPVLPYRKLDIKKFWDEYKNANSFLKAIAKFNLKLYELLEKDASVALQYDQAETDIKKLKEMNTIDAMIYLTKVQLSLIEIRKSASELLMDGSIKKSDASI